MRYYMINFPTLVQVAMMMEDSSGRTYATTAAACVAMKKVADATSLDALKAAEAEVAKLPKQALESMAMGCCLVAGEDVSGNLVFMDPGTVVANISEATNNTLNNIYEPAFAG